MDNPPQQQAGLPATGATIGGFQPPINSVIGQPTFFFARGVPAPPTGIYILTPAPPGELSSLGSRWTGFV